MNKNVNVAYQLIEDMALNHYQWSSERTTTKKTPRKYEVDALNL